MIKVLFVCHGNICRSPTAEGVFKKILEVNNCEDLCELDSAGIIGYHEGEPPDIRAQLAADQRGVDLSYIRSRPIVNDDFRIFDLILCMDNSNVHNLLEICPEMYSNKIQLFLNFSVKFKGLQVPDPYSGGAEGFERVLDMVEDGALGLFKSLSSKK